MFWVSLWVYNVVNINKSWSGNEGGEQCFGLTDLASKCMRIVNFCSKSSRFVDFENTVDSGSAVNFGTDSGLCLSWCWGRWVLNDIWIIDLSSALVGMLMSSSNFCSELLAHLHSGARVLMAFSLTSLPLNFYTSVSRFEQKYWEIYGLGGKKAWIGRFVYSYSPPLLILKSN